MTFADAPGPFHHPGCLGCGAANPWSLGLRVRARDGQVRASLTFDEHQCGAPGYVHGGAVAVVLDDVLGTVPMVLGHPSVTANLNVDYRASIRLGAAVEVAAWLVRREGRKFFVAGEVRQGDLLLAEATALFVEAPADRFTPAERAVGRW